MNALTGHFRSHICPYCFRDFLLSDTPYRCANPDPRRCPPEVDAVRKKVWEHDTRIPKVVRPSVRLFAQEAECDCGTLSRQRLCPHCHMELPLGLGRHRSLILTVIGAKDSGKSHYLAVLITQLRKHLCGDLNFALVAINDATRDRFRNELYRPIYEKGRAIDNTQSGRQLQNSVRQPLIYDLNLFGNGRGRSIRRRSVTLVFFDTAGEDLEHEETMSIANQYICRSDGIILLLDPLQLPYVRQQFRDSRLLPEESRETGEILSRTVRLIRKSGRRSRGKISIPLALAFSKFDAVSAVDGLVGPQMQLHSNSSHEGGFNVADHQAVNDEMQSLIASWDGSELIQQVRSSFKSYGFFGLSALGCNPHRDERIPHVLPKRVEDPFLWLLYRHGLMKKSKA